MIKELDLFVIQHLFSRGVLNHQDMNIISAERVKQEKAAKRLDVVEGRGSRAFPELVEGVKDTQKHLAVMLETMTEKASRRGIVSCNVSTIPDGFTDIYYNTIT